MTTNNYTFDDLLNADLIYILEKVTEHLSDEKDDLEVEVSEMANELAESLLSNGKPDQGYLIGYSYNSGKKATAERVLNEIARLLYCARGKNEHQN